MIKNIKDFYDALKEKNEFPKMQLDDIKNKRMEELEIFSVSIKNLDEKISPSDDDRKACEFAMEFEGKGYKYYENMMKSAKDENLIKLLQFLLDEENKHYQAIDNLYTYLTDSQNWFMYEEGSFPQGG